MLGVTHFYLIYISIYDFAHIESDCVYPVEVFEGSGKVHYHLKCSLHKYLHTLSSLSLSHRVFRFDKGKRKHAGNYCSVLHRVCASCPAQHASGLSCLFSFLFLVFCSCFSFIYECVYLHYF